jgi:hypothetical protein
MRKERISYSSPLDALVEVTRRLSIHELREHMDSVEFFHRWSQGQLTDEAEHVEWANDYRHYLVLRQDLEERLKHVA